MQQNHVFKIYNASAGSGKTYTLVKEYLKILFKSNNPEPFKKILAITFTNKAVAEMKERILDNLKEFSNEEILKTPTNMFVDICNDMQIDAQTIHKKAVVLLNTILHNYAAFDVSTIDGFTHKLIRTFAYDLKLPLNFEVELDQEALLNEAVDSLISKAGTDDNLTRVLVDFAIEKADDDKSWDVAFDFNKISKLLVNENDSYFINTLKNKTLDDFEALKKTLKKELKKAENNIKESAIEALNLIENNGLEFQDFSRSTLPNHFKKASELYIDKLYDNQLETNISERKSIYTAKLNSQKKERIDAILPQIEGVFHKTKQAVFQFKFLQNFYKNSTPLSVLNAINKELNSLKEDQNKMLISEFNTIISNQIKDQPTPFIYERIGEKFNHYFIDEFQDTSVMQWENLKPLLENALASQTGSTMLVGDAKQAIYRWRGGKAEQFIDLFNKTQTPFPTKQHIENLPTNYRSFKEVINFNNGFFKYLAHQVFNEEDYQNLYENAHQNTSKVQEGYVQLSFLDVEKEDDRDEVFSENVLKKINDCQKNGYVLQDICVLVRKKKEGVAIANYLSKNEIPIISSETLLINNAPEVVFINNILTLLIQPKNSEIKIAVLNYLATTFNIENKHAFFTKHLNLSTSQFFKSLEFYKISIDNNALLQQPLYDLVETIVMQFNLVKTSHAYIQFYLDIVLDFSQKKGSDISGFLSYFEKKKETFSIISPTGQNAIQIMTIHKSKGLEFPVVIFPYADLDIYRELEPKEWFILDKEKYQGFPYTLLNYNKDFESFGEEGSAIYTKHQAELELDNINLLYVALTRAVEQLFVISTKDISAKGDVNEKKYSGLFISYLNYLGLWNDSETIYTFGNPIKTSLKTEVSKVNTVQKEFISTSKESLNIKVVTKSGFLWDTLQKEAIEKGNLIHDLLSHIIVKEDIDFVFTEYINKAIISLQQASELKKTVFKIVNHEVLQPYYTLDNTIYNERDIITKEGIMLRPDRVMVNSENEAVIIDYKTGVIDKKHDQQLQFYQDVLKEMNITVKKKLLVYINDDIIVKEV